MPAARRLSSIAEVDCFAKLSTVVGSDKLEPRATGRRTLVVCEWLCSFSCHDRSAEIFRRRVCERERPSQIFMDVSLTKTRKLFHARTPTNFRESSVLYTEERDTAVRDLQYCFFFSI